MVYALKVLNSEATLNDFYEVGAANIYKGSDAEIVMRIIQPDKKSIRYIPDAGAVITFDLMKSDGTILIKTATYPFADDRSIIKIVLTNAETALLISQSLVAKIVEGSSISYALLQSGFKMVTLTPAGC